TSRAHAEGEGAAMNAPAAGRAAGRAAAQNYPTGLLSDDQLERQRAAMPSAQLMDLSAIENYPTEILSRRRFEYATTLGDQLDQYGGHLKAIAQIEALQGPVPHSDEYGSPVDEERYWADNRRWWAFELDHDMLLNEFVVVRHGGPLPCSMALRQHPHYPR